MASLEKPSDQAMLGLLFSPGLDSEAVPSARNRLFWPHVSIEGPHGICSVGLMFCIGSNQSSPVVCFRVCLTLVIFDKDDSHSTKLFETGNLAQGPVMGSEPSRQSNSDSGSCAPTPLPGHALSSWV